MDDCWCQAGRHSRQRARTPRQQTTAAPLPCHKASALKAHARTHARTHLLLRRSSHAPFSTSCSIHQGHRCGASGRACGPLYTPVTSSSPSSTVCRICVGGAVCRVGLGRVCALWQASEPGALAAVRCELDACCCSDSHWHAAAATLPPQESSRSLTLPAGLLGPNRCSVTNLAASHSSAARSSSGRPCVPHTRGRGTLVCMHWVARHARTARPDTCTVACCCRLLTGPQPGAPGGASPPHAHGASVGHLQRAGPQQLQPLRRVCRTYRVVLRPQEVAVHQLRVHLCVCARVCVRV